VAVSSPESYLKGCLRGERAAQEALYHYFAPKVLGICMRYTRTRAQAQDLAQEAMIKVFERLADFRDQGSLAGWVHRLAVRTAIDHYRVQANQRAETDLDEAYDLSSDDTNQLAQLEAQEVLALMNRLPDGYRLVLNLFAVEGYSHKEISEQLGIEEKTSSSQLCKARKLLLEMLRQQETLSVNETSRRKSL
jgi:RNA polymerase sigma factor (sigma-70 family)